MQGGITPNNLIQIGFNTGIEETNGLTYYKRGETILIFTEIEGKPYILSQNADFNKLAEEIYRK